MLLRRFIPKKIKKYIVNHPSLFKVINTIRYPSKARLSSNIEAMMTFKEMEYLLNLGKKAKGIIVEIGV